MNMERNFVTFYSPGTMIAEQTTQPIDAWDVEEAIRRARSVVERHSSRPYGFQFTTRSRGDDELDSGVTARSPMYYLGGRVVTREEIETRNDPNEETLRYNLRVGGYNRVVVNENSWRWTMPLRADDVVLDVTL